MGEQPESTTIPDGVFLLRPVNREFLRGALPAPALGREVPLLLSALLLLGGLFGLATSGRDLYRRHLLHQTGVTVEAEVVSAFYDHEQRGPRVRYRFTAAAGGRIQERLGVPDADAFARAQRERRVRVVYDPRAPEQSRIVNPGGWTRRVVSVTIGALMTCCGGIFLWLAFSTRQLLLRGQVRVGELTRCSRRLTQKGVRLVVEYRFCTAAGKPRRGRGRAPRLDLREAPLPEPGTPVAVLHLGRRHVLL